MTSFTHFLDELNHSYERLHTRKEDAFWSEKMGLVDDADAARTELDALEIEQQRFLREPDRLARVRAELERADAPAGDRPTEDERVALEGWLATLEANAIESDEARALAEEIIAAEGTLARERGRLSVGYEDPAGGFVETGLVKLGVMLLTEEDEGKRRAAWNGLRSIESFVLENRFVELVRMRNRFGRLTGGEDYYDGKVRRVEGMSKAEIFALLDELEVLTRDAAQRFVDGLVEEKGEERVKPWNVRYFSAGSVTAEQDPYFPFSKSVERWGRSFAALGVEYQDAELVLDLVDRKGKYENGFMHGPVPAWRDHGNLRPARIQFTANAIPGMIGAGQGATRTLFHEGGHAAHFANMDMPSPCFATEYAPSSVAFGETQSMFLDSLLEDADWMTRYARTVDGEPMPFALIERAIRSKQPAAAWGLRGMLAVCYAERAIYEIPDDELSAERIRSEIRAVERRFLLLEDGAARPALSVPHLIAGEASAYYHGYVLALIAVHHTRTFFLERDGHLVDNPRIGPDLRETYWKPGNGKRFLELVQELTGKPLTAEALALDVNHSPDEAIAVARAAVAKLDSIPELEGDVELGGEIRVDHGRETIAATEGVGFEGFASRFSNWIDSIGPVES